MNGRNSARIAFSVSSYVAHMQLVEYGTIEDFEILDYACSIQACCPWSVLSICRKTLVAGTLLKFKDGY